MDGDGVTHTSENVLDDLGCTREDMAALVAKREKRIAALEAALEPFAAYASEIEDVAASCGDNPRNVVGPAKYDECLAARKALMLGG